MASHSGQAVAEVWVLLRFWKIAAPCRCSFCVPGAGSRRLQPQTRNADCLCVARILLSSEISLSIPTVLHYCYVCSQKPSTLNACWSGPKHGTRNKFKFVFNDGAGEWPELFNHNVKGCRRGPNSMLQQKLRPVIGKLKMLPELSCCMC